MVTVPPQPGHFHVVVSREWRRKQTLVSGVVCTPKAPTLRLRRLRVVDVASALARRSAVPVCPAINKFLGSIHVSKVLK